MRENISITEQDWGSVQTALDQLAQGLPSHGVGSPNGVVRGNPGDVYISRGGGAGTTLWVKESGTDTDTGWVGK